MTAGESAPQRNFGNSGSVFFLPTVMRPVESPNKHKELCFGSGRLLLRRHRQRERAGGSGRGRLKKERTEGSGAKRGPGRDECQICHKSVHFHPSPSSSPSILPPPSLPSSWQVFTPPQKDSSDGDDSGTSVRFTGQAPFCKSRR